MGSRETQGEFASFIITNSSVPASRGVWMLREQERIPVSGPRVCSASTARAGAQERPPGGVLLGTCHARAGMKLLLHCRALVFPGEFKHRIAEPQKVGKAL